MKKNEKKNAGQVELFVEVAKVAKKITKKAAEPKQAKKNVKVVKAVKDAKVIAKQAKKNVKVVKAVKDAKVIAMPAEFEAAVANLDSLELFARRERDFAIIKTVAKAHKIKATLSGLWIWFAACDADKGVDLKIDLLEKDIDLHFACEKKCYCYHEPEDGSGYGKQEQTAEQIKAKYGSLKVA